LPFNVSSKGQQKLIITKGVQAKKFGSARIYVVISIVIVPEVNAPVMGMVTVIGETQPAAMLLLPEIPAPLTVIVHEGVGETFVRIVTATAVSLTNLKSTISMSPLYSTNDVPRITFRDVKAQTNIAEDTATTAIRHIVTQTGICLLIITFHLLLL